MSLISALSFGAAPQSAVQLDSYKAAFGKMIDRLKAESTEEIESRFLSILKTADPSSPAFDINALLYEAETLKTDFVDLFKGQPEAASYSFAPTNALDLPSFRQNMGKIKTLAVRLMQLKLEEFRKESQAARKPEAIKEAFKKVNDFIARFQRIIKKERKLTAQFVKTPPPPPPAPIIAPAPKPVLVPAPTIVTPAARRLANKFLSEGDKCLAAEKYELAIQSYSKALEHNPNLAQAYEGRGWAKFHSDKYEFTDSVEDFERAIKLDPKALDSYNGLGWVKYYDDKLEEAKKAFEEAIKLSRRYAGPYKGLADVNYKEKKYEESLKALEKALKLKPKDYEIHSKIGWNKYQLGKQEEATKYFSRAIKINPKSADAYYGRALANNELAKKIFQAKSEAEKFALELASRAAAVDYAKACELDPEYKKKPAPETGDQVAFSEGYRQFGEGNYQAALAAFNKISAKRRNSFGIQYNIGTCYEKMGKLKEALEVFKLAQKLIPAKERPVPEAEKKELAERIAHLEKALKLPPSAKPSPAATPAKPSNAAGSGITITSNIGKVGIGQVASGGGSTGVRPTEVKVNPKKDAVEDPDEIHNQIITGLNQRFAANVTRKLKNQQNYKITVEFELSFLAKRGKAVNPRTSRPKIEIFELVKDQPQKPKDSAMTRDFTQKINAAIKEIKIEALKLLIPPVLEKRLKGKPLTIPFTFSLSN